MQTSWCSTGSQGEKAQKKSREKLKSRLKNLGQQNVVVKIHKGVDKGRIESRCEKRHKTGWVTFAKIAIVVHDCMLNLCLLQIMKKY